MLWEFVLFEMQIPRGAERAGETGVLGSVGREGLRVNTGCIESCLFSPVCVASLTWSKITGVKVSLGSFIVYILEYKRGHDCLIKYRSNFCLNGVFFRKLSFDWHRNQSPSHAEAPALAYDIIVKICKSLHLFSYQTENMQSLNKKSITDKRQNKSASYKIKNKPVIFEIIFT